VDAILAKDYPSKAMLNILIPGMQLQPLVNNGTTKFGYRLNFTAL
jgi:hypothetical protein